MAFFIHTLRMGVESNLLHEQECKRGALHGKTICCDKNNDDIREKNCLQLKLHSRLKSFEFYGRKKKTNSSNHFSDSPHNVGSTVYLIKANKKRE